MADLDSFFAKKNKKKVKGKKFANPDDISKRLQEKEKKLEKDLQKVEPKKLLDEVLVSVMNNPTAQSPKKEEEEEWKDFKDDREHDLTDLKLSKLLIENDEEYGGYGSGEDCDRGSKGDQSDGVWGKTAAVTETSKSVPVVEAKAPPTVNTQPTSYLPPHLRHGSSTAQRVGGNRRNKQAPDITNEMAFPLLGVEVKVAATHHTPWSSNKPRTDDVRYENVRYGNTRTIDHGPPKVNTSNRFNALSDRS